MEKFNHSPFLKNSMGMISGFTETNFDDFIGRNHLSKKYAISRRTLMFLHQHCSHSPRKPEAPRRACAFSASEIRKQYETY